MSNRTERKPIYETYEQLAEELIGEQYHNVEEYDKKRIDGLANEIYEQFLQINNKLVSLKYEIMKGKNEKDNK